MAIKSGLHTIGDYDRELDAARREAAEWKAIAERLADCLEDMRGSWAPQSFRSDGLFDHSGKALAAFDRKAGKP